MIWQDLVFAIGQGAFTVALFPSVFSREKPHRATCWLTGVVLAIFAVAYATMGMYTATTSTALCGALWLILAIQRRT